MVTAVHLLKKRILNLHYRQSYTFLNNFSEVPFKYLVTSLNTGWQCNRYHDRLVWIPSLLSCSLTLETAVLDFNKRQVHPRFDFESPSSN